MKSKHTRKIVWSVLTLLILMNIVAIFHSYKFTHFAAGHIKKTADPKKLSFGKKLMTLATGVNMPRPVNDKMPRTPYRTIRLQSNKEIECWYMPVSNAKGTVALFHGYGSNKSDMLSKAEVFMELGYNVLLPDFMGSGGSEGNQTTVGFWEGEQVKTCYDYLAGHGEKHIYLFGTSMGAAAIMKALHNHKISPAGIMIECPFGSMYQTVCARFRTMHAPVFPMAGLLVFWGGAQNGFWAFGHNPATYAKDITCPTLLMYGAKDEKVSRQETDEIFANLKGKKFLSIYPEAAHENYLNRYRNQWTSDISQFLQHN